MSFNLNRLQKKIGIEFHQAQVLEQALTHRSIGHSNNERLEFLGDSVLGFVVAETLYERFPEADEGVLSRLRASLVNGGTLAELATTLNIGEELVLGPGEMKSGGRHRKSILSDALEAIIGALYLDKGFNETRVWLLSLLKDKLDVLTIEMAQKDPKTRLQEYMQSRGHKVPEYKVLTTTGSDHDQLFEVQCKVTGISEPLLAKANSRKKAEQKTALKALKLLNV
ncbi:MAG: ribonuclease III [Piscirickettsiaceae bacterium]|nr:MAG: ribonuclease III [Piscirickettsiaceae bacterium]PCI72192.1 MAG: ribonuclease III [Piscirickettsiaceae bacterium]